MLCICVLRLSGCTAMIDMSCHVFVNQNRPAKIEVESECREFNKALTFDFFDFQFNLQNL